MRKIMCIAQLNDKCFFGGSITNKFTCISVLDKPFTVMIATLKLNN